MAIEELQLESRPPLTVEEFEALAETEGWDEDTRVELLDGEVVWMSPINDPHAACVKRLNHLFNRRYALFGTFFEPESTANVGLPVVLTDHRTEVLGPPLAVYGGIRLTF